MLHDKQKRTTEKAIAVGSFLAAVAFAFTAVMIDETHQVGASNCTVIAQFLLLTASIFGIDYKYNTIFPNDNDEHHNKTNKSHPKPQPTKHPKG